MKRTLIALCAASTVAMTAPLIGQSQATTTADSASAKEMTLTGCLQKNKSGGYWLTNASMGSSASAASAATTTSPRGASASTTADNSATSSTTATGTSGSASASTTASDRGAQAAGVNWNLENGKDLDQYVNQKIQVTGSAKGSTSGDEVKGTTGREQEARDFDVKSVRMIAASCS